MATPSNWRPYSVAVTLSFDVLVNADSPDTAQRFALQAFELCEVEPGYANGEQPKLDGSYGFTCHARES